MKRLTRKRLLKPDEATKYQTVREQVAKEFPPRGIGNWNLHCLTRMSRNPNTRAHSSRT